MKTGVRCALTMVLCACAATVAAPAWAQSLLTDSRELVGATIRLTTSRSEQVVGEFVSADQALIRLSTSDGIVTLPLQDVYRLDRRGDPVKNGVITGLVVGGALSALSAQGYERRGDWARDAVIGTALAGAVGALIDHWRVGWTPVVFTVSPAAASTRLSGWGGVALALRTSF